ncbi:hypothetical protein, partial [Leptospira interrogans]
FSSSFHSNLLPLFLEKKVSTFMLLGQTHTFRKFFFIFYAKLTLLTIFLLVRGGSDYCGKDTKTIYR